MDKKEQMNCKHQLTEKNILNPQSYYSPPKIYHISAFKKKLRAILSKLLMICLCNYALEIPMKSRATKGV